jgi:hypothetical protein
MKNRIIPLLFCLLFVVSCSQKNDRIVSHTVAVAVDPSTTQTVAAGSRVQLKASVTGASETDIKPVWSVENNLGTFDPAQGKETTFTAGTSAGTAKIYATYGGVRGETSIVIACPGSTGGSTGTGGTGGSTTTGGSGGGCGGSGGSFSGSFYGLFSETYRLPGILLDTNSSRFPDGGCIGVWPEGGCTTLSDGTQPGEMSEGLKGLRCDVSDGGGGWWIQFGSDDLSGLSKTDVMVAKDMSAFSGGSLKFDVRASNDVLIAVKWGDGTPLPNAYYTLRELGIPHDDRWHSVSIQLSRFAGIDFHKIKVPASFSAAPGCVDFTFYIDNVRWEK